MGDQQQLPHTGLFNAHTSARPSDHPMMSMPLYPNPAARFEHMPIPAAAAPIVNAPYFFGDAVAQYIHRSGVPPQLMCSYPSMPETFIAGPVPTAPHRDYPHMAMPTQAYTPQLSYPTVGPPPVQAASLPNPVGQVTKPVKTVVRERKALEVRNPKTQTLIDLSDDSSKKPVLNETSPPAPEESPPVKNAVDNTTDKPQPVWKPLIPLEELMDTVPKDKLEKKDDVSEVPDQIDHEPPACPDESEQPASDSDEQVHESKVVRLLGETTDVESSAVSEEEEDDDEVVRKVYNREFLLKCKDSPITKFPPEDFLFIPLGDPGLRRKGSRNVSRPSQRVIRLNTAITVKRVKGAFVPSQLQKKEANGETDPRQLLSRELNVILNRLSDVNLTETVSDIRKLEFNSPEDVQLLAKLVFQKGIRQSKYSRVFANLCKQLKGFSVSGSETLEVMVIQQSQELFNTPLETLITELNALIDAKIEAAKDESIKKIIREDRETNIIKKTEAYQGNMAFLAELYLCRLFAPKTMLQCLRKLKDSSAPEALTSLLILLKTCGQELEQQSKGQIEECFAKLNSYLKSDKIPAHQLYKIQELCELRARGWKKLDPTQPTPSPAEAPRRSNDDKMRRLNITTVMEAKRKPAQSVNPLMPSSLAVTQQPYDSRKLGPQVDNWTQGSGKFLRNPADNNSQQGGNKILSNATNRSREASPRVPGLQGVWATRQSGNIKPREDYPTVLERCRCHSRKIVDVLRLGEEDAGPILQDLKDVERCAVLHALLELSMDKDEKLRNMIGVFLISIVDKSQITSSDLESGCKMFFEKCDDDFLEDYPKGWEYIAQILQHLIQKEKDHLSILLSVLKHLHSNERGATVLAHCLRLSTMRLGEDVVEAKWRAQKLDWKNLGVVGEVSKFVEKHGIGFTTSPSHDQLKQLAELCKNSSTTLEQFTAYFKQFSTVPPNFVRLCVQTMLSNSTGLQRPNIDHRVLGLSILVDHKPEREAEVVQALTEYSSKTATDRWRKSLLDKKVISSEALQTSNDSITKSLLRDP